MFLNFYHRSVPVCFLKYNLICMGSTNTSTMHNLFNIKIFQVSQNGMLLQANVKVCCDHQPAHF